VVFQTWRADQVKISMGLSICQWTPGCSSALIQSGHNWFESNGISFLGELLYTGNNQEVWQFYFSTLQATVYDITAFFSNYTGGLIFVGAKDMTDPMHVNTVNDTRPS